jgi:hypothetical protein
MFKNYKLPGSDQILTDLIQAGGGTLWFEIHKLGNSILSKVELPDQSKESIMVPHLQDGR